jgi:rhomboid family GlyGly-CTERM serine protease
MVTAHLIHAGLAHLLLNLAGLVLVFALFGHLFNLRIWVLSLAACMVGVSAGQLLFCPELQWYRGFSGVLHGFMAVGLIEAIQQNGQHRALGLWGLALLSGKLLVELLLGPTGASMLSLDAPVIVEAHLFGALTGGVIAVLAAGFAPTAMPVPRD